MIHYLFLGVGFTVLLLEGIDFAHFHHSSQEIWNNTFPQANTDWLGPDRGAFAICCAILTIIEANVLYLFNMKLP